MDVEAAIVFGSWSRSGGGAWSDVDLLIVSDHVKNINPLERFKTATELKPPKTDIFLYTYDELKSMLNKNNPLAISALAEGKPIKTSKRIQQLINQAKQQYVRKGRMWISKNTL